jgi:hypothetical protein
MSNAFVNFLSGAADGSGNLRSYQHATRLYVDNNYQLTPKAGWIYYVKVNINPDIKNLITDTKVKKEFTEWLNRYKGTVGLLAKTVDLPKFSIETETLNQYNRKTVIQKKINYNPITIVFHDDMANVSLNLWKSYYQYYYGDSLNPTGTSPQVLFKYQDNKYDNRVLDANYGLNNGESERFINSIDIYQLHQKKFTNIKLINPIIKEWSSDNLDQSQGNRLLTSRMTIEYETVIYDTAATNSITKDNPGFNKDHYDNTPSPLSIGGQGTNSVFGPGGLVAGASSIFGTLNNPDASPLDILNAAIQGRNLVRNAGNITKAGLLQEGQGIFNSVLSGVASSNGNITSGALNGLNQAIAPAGIRVPSGSQAPDQTVAVQRVLNNPTTT